MWLSLTRMVGTEPRSGGRLSSPRVLPKSGGAQISAGFGGSTEEGAFGLGAVICWLVPLCCVWSLLLWSLVPTGCCCVFFHSQLQVCFSSHLSMPLFSPSRVHGSILWSSFWVGSQGLLHRLHTGGFPALALAWCREIRGSCCILGLPSWDRQHGSSLFWGPHRYLGVL